ncbi:uncharacterized protein LOC122851132 [Aphidius gifuensis]|uniref:uncharacterized protein LOC122851132 n=1 Tax=Aphidius gifuensis TaxID=684658 RepID=UPI001CDCE4AE|nr:uncharacterized protein LOC122851132 [Aphidius gifuensis]
MIEDAEKSVNDYMRDSRRDKGKTLKKQYKKLMCEMGSLFYKRPQLEKICKDRESELVLSCFTKYKFKATDDDDEKPNDLIYILNCFGYNLTSLNVDNYPFSKVMPLINNNCPGLKELVVEFEEINDQDFENVFSNMHKLEKLMITWDCGKLTLPMTLVKTLEQVGGTLKKLYLLCRSKDEVFLPDSWASMSSQLIALERLNLYGFQLSQTLIDSIGEIPNLTNLETFPRDDYPMDNKKINMSPIVNLKHLEGFNINWDWGVTDEFLINLCNNSKKLQNLRFLGTNITDNGMSALNNLSELKRFSLKLNCLGSGSTEKTNKYITDESIECLFNEKLMSLNLSNCTKISNRSVIKAFENLPNLSYLSVENTNVTIKVVEELSKLIKFHEKKLHVYVSFEDCNGIFKSLMESHNVEFTETSS